MLANKADTGINNPVTKRQIFQLYEILLEAGVSRLKLKEHLNDPAKLQKLIEDIDPWAEERKRIEAFYKRFFDRVIDWSKITLPEKTDHFKKIEYIFKDITCDQMMKAYIERFHPYFDHPVNCGWVFTNDSIDEAIIKQQDRPSDDYVITHVGDIQPDMLYTSYEDGISNQIQFMIPIEGILAMTRRHFETGKMYDKGVTNLAALFHGRPTSTHFGMMMFFQHGGKHGQFTLDYDSHRNTRIGGESGRGLRQVKF